MTVYKIRVRGNSPLLINKMSQDALEGLIPGQGGARKKNAVVKRSMEEIALDALHKDEKTGKPVFPLAGILNSFCQASSQFSKAKGRGTYKSIAAGVFRIVHEYAIIHEPGKPQKSAEWIVDLRRGNNANAGKGVAVPLVRPKFEKWEISFDAEIDEDLLPEAIAQDILSYAGRVVGIGAYRPANMGPFGTFNVVEFDPRE